MTAETGGGSWRRGQSVTEILTVELTLVIQIISSTNLTRAPEHLARAAYQDVFFLVVDPFFVGFRYNTVCMGCVQSSGDVTILDDRCSVPGQRYRHTYPATGDARLLFPAAS